MATRGPGPWPPATVVVMQAPAQQVAPGKLETHQGAGGDCGSSQTGISSPSLQDTPTRCTRRPSTTTPLRASLQGKGGKGDMRCFEPR